MGQQQSQTASREPVVRRPPTRPTAPPSARPVSDLGPKGPSYNNPVNKVLPAVLPTKHQLRPVSQEMSKIIPNYKDIYAYDDDIEDNDSLDTNHAMDHELSNGKILHSNGGIPNGKVAHSETGSVASDSSSSGRTPSVSFDPSGKYKVHRRQQSATSSLYSRENTIEEESKESLELRGKLDSMSTSCPQVSIPVRSTFEMDSSLNMTYAQLAEARRNKTLSMIEQKTGRRIEDLSNDLSEHASRPVTNLVRSNSTKSTKSMDALDGRKKKQRAPAPPVNRPPAPPAPVTSKSAPSTPRGPIRSMSQHAPPRPNNPPPPVYNRGYSVQFEPPADYDMEDISIPPPPPLQGILKTSKSYNKPRANNVEYTNSNGLDNDRQRERKPPSRSNSQRVPPIVAPVRQEDPLLLEIQKLAEKKAARRQMSEEKEKEKQRLAEEEREKEKVAEEERLKQKAEKELAEEKEKAAAQEKSETTGASNNTEPSLVFSSGNVKPPLQKQDAVEEEKKVPPPPPPPGVIPPVEKSATGTSTLERKPSTTSTTSSAESANRRLSSLLQHDIKIAAQAKATKIVKKSTKVKEKPKDPADVFREQLEKAASDREHRSKTEMSIDELMKKKREKENNVPVTGRVIEKDTEKQTVFKSDKLVVKKQDSNGAEKPKEVITLDLDTKENPKPKFEKKSKKKDSKVANGSAAKSYRQRQQESESEEEKDLEAVDDVRNSSIYSREDWTPCDDLDSDDNLSDKDQMVTSRGHVQGFKSTIVPNKVNDLKIKEKKGKGKENKYTKRASDAAAEERRKYDSIKRFKKSVHKSVRNAFGSISKASGKILSRQKSEDLEIVNEPPPPPPNWKLRSSVSAPQAMNQNFETEQAMKYMVPHGFSDHNSDSSDEEEYTKASVNFGPEVDHTDDEDDSDKEEIHQMKRAGVAYIGKKGQIVVLPEYENVPAGKDRKSGEFEGHAPKIYQKKKKFTFDDTVRKKERLKREEMLKEEVKKEEEKREEERLKGEAKEKEMERVREMEARERLQRLETQAQIQQQLLQQQQMGILSAPPLPPPAGFQQGYNASVDYSQLLSQSNLPQSGFNLPYGSQPMFSAPIYSGMPNMSLEDFSQYMRMMSMQGSAPNPQQQYAFMLNSVNLANPGMQGGGLLHMLGHQDGTKYFKTSSQEYLDSDRNQVFNNWVGPTKQPASKATVVPTPQIVQSSGGMTVGANSVTVSGPRVSTHSGGQIRTNNMVNDDESDTSDGLSPQNAALASAAAAVANGGPTIINGFDGEGGHRTKISVSGGHNPRGCNRQTSFSSVSSHPGSETSAER
ncbi:protein PRRC2C-like [Argopecten irradians]|uniref:protein PRRC2C-like n=1 Tax=Argopecten irradians TaxID=31199 RepID=UPI003722A4E4